MNKQKDPEEIGAINIHYKQQLPHLLLTRLADGLGKDGSLRFFEQRFAPVACGSPAFRCEHRKLSVLVVYLYYIVKVKHFIC